MTSTDKFITIGTTCKSLEYTTANTFCG